MADRLRRGVRMSLGRNVAASVGIAIMARVVATLRNPIVSLIGGPTNQTSRPFRRFVCLGALAIVCLSVLLPGTIACAEESAANPSEIRKSAQGQEVTYRGCLSEGPHGRLKLAVEGKEELGFELVGDTKALPTHPFFLPVSVRGTEVSPGILAVKDAEVLKLTAELDRSLTDPARWIEKRDRTHGVAFAVPKEPLLKKESPSRPDLWPQDTVAFFHTWFPLYPESDYRGVYLSMSVKATGSVSAPFRIRKESGWINGVRYTELCEGSDEVDDCYVFCSQNNRNYRFDFSFFRGKTPWALDVGCLFPVASPQQERSFIRLFLSRVAFFRPEIPEAGR